MIQTETIRGGEQNLDMLAELLMRARRALPDDPFGAEQFIGSAVALLPRRSETPDAPKHFVTGGLASWQVMRVRALVRERLCEPLTIADMAGAARLSSSHFARAFVQSFGCPPHRYIQYERLDRAKALLRETGDPLAYIALACGFADQAHFSRVFRQLEGKTPSVWRQASLLLSVLGD
jgi:AraC family transcriptional regulator